ncbi:MAG: SDR family NAD(P)-dependent oxidoreductase [Bacteroidia bacterium]|jgi:NADP-dependent 3-hydroxy acid dehydrogenase YdfG
MSKIAYITGASSGIGKAIATRMAAEKYNLILAARRSDRLQELAAELQQTYGIKTLLSSYDIRNRQAVKDAVESIPEDWRDIQVLVNNAGLASGLSTLEHGDIDDWEVMIDTNIKGLLFITRNILPLIRHDGSGHIINIGSIAGKEVYPNGNVYCSTKHAVDALSKAMRLELSVYPIRVSAIHPGAVETEFSVVRFHGDAQRAQQVYAGFDNLIAGDIADAAWYIVSRPAHVNINELIIMPSAQPVAGVIHRKA